MSTSAVSVELAGVHYRAGSLQEAEAVCREILERDPGHPEALHWLGLIALDGGRNESAAELFAGAIAGAPSNAVPHHNLGEAYRRAGRPEDALRCFRQAVALKPGYAQAHFSLGTTLDNLGEFAQAIDHYLRALEIRPDYAEALNNLGNAYRATGRTKEAIGSYRKALDCRPGFADALNNLGNALGSEGALEEAITCLREAIAAAPNFAAAHNNLGSVLLASGHLKDARAQFERARECDPALAVLHANLGALDQEEGRPARAIECYRKGLELDPGMAHAWINIATSLSEQGMRVAAREAYGRALEIAPSDAVRVLQGCVLAPIVESKVQMLQARREFAAHLAELSTRPLAIGDPAREVNSVPFYLAYHGMNDRGLQQALGRIYEKACPSLKYCAPHCDSPDVPPTDRTIRLGFLSRRIGRDSVARVLMSGLVGRLSRERFSVNVYSFPHARNRDLETISASAERVVMLPPVLAAARERLAAERLDVLCYIDIGMDPLTYFLAFARLAPVQCATWQHPVSTGIPNVDYFVSSALFEPGGAEAHYSERLVRLESLPAWYERPRTPSPLKPRAALGLREGRTQYVCPQSPYKIHPDFDAVLGGILRADPGGEVVLIEGKLDEWARALMGRLRSSIPDVVERVRCMPRLSSEDFQHLLASADVLLDPLHWSGGITTLDALAFGTPIVTLPGALMRGRVTYGCYRHMGMPDCVAKDEQEYVSLAVRLGTDRGYREAMRAKILERNVALYRNEAAVGEFEQFVCRALTADGLVPA